MLKDYIVISNKADEVSRIALEKLGLSTKRNDDNTIGQFGSGIKYAPIAALRKNLEWFFTGYDKNGPFTLRYVVEKEDGIDCVVYQYDDYKKSSSFTLDAGVLSWEDAFQILREPIANAMDNARVVEDGWYNVSVITVDTDKPETMEKLKPRLGEFSVYITASPELMEIVRDYDKYFSVNREVLSENRIGKIIKKIDKTSRFYSKDVLVKADDDHQSIFDYQIDNLELNEERTVKSLWDLDWNVARIVCSTCDDDVAEKYLKEIIKADSESSIWELSRLSSQNFKYIITEEAKDSWTRIWNKITDNKGVIIESIFGDSESTVFAVKQRGYNPVVLKNNVAISLLKAFEFKTVFDILGEKINYETDFDISNYPKLIQAYEIASFFEKGLIEFKNKIATFKTKKEGVLGMLITNEDQEKIIIIDENHASYGSISEIVGTLIHEYDHFRSNIGDSSDMIGREFRNLADTRIGNLMFDFYENFIFEQTEDGICVTNKNVYSLANFKYDSEYSEILNGYILNFGGKMLVVQAEKGAIEQSGSCQISSDGESVFVPVKGSFNIHGGI